MSSPPNQIDRALPPAVRASSSSSARPGAAHCRRPARSSLPGRPPSLESSSRPATSPAQRRWAGRIPYTVADHNDQLSGRGGLGNPPPLVTGGEVSPPVAKNSGTRHLSQLDNQKNWSRLPRAYESHADHRSPKEAVVEHNLSTIWQASSTMSTGLHLPGRAIGLTGTHHDANSIHLHQGRHGLWRWRWSSTVKFHASGTRADRPVERDGVAALRRFTTRPRWSCW